MFAHIKCYKVTKYVMTIEQIANVHVPSRTKFRIAVVWKMKCETQLTVVGTRCPFTHMSSVSFSTLKETIY